jgi:hypothetical protein
MWAGDTAQTISVESVFTFEQLGALIYRYYVRGLLLPYCVDQPNHLLSNQLGHSSGPLASQKCINCS